MDGELPEWIQQATASFKLLREAISLSKDVADALPDDTAQVVTQSLAEAEKAAGVAEAQIAKGLGYELCFCTFPPTPMLRIGHFTPMQALQALGRNQGEPVYGCPRCRQDTAYGHKFERTVRPGRVVVSEP